MARNDPGLQRPVSGMLQYRPTPTDDYGPRWEAHLLDSSSKKDLILPLYWARLKRIDAGVMHLAGIEEGGRTNTKAKPSRWKQSWLCAVDPASALPLLAKIQARSIAGFALEDDNDPEPDSYHLIDGS